MFKPRKGRESGNELKVLTLAPNSVPRLIDVGTSITNSDNLFTQPEKKSQEHSRTNTATKESVDNNLKFEAITLTL
eukprot:scaffold148891_cov20-Cyclotella_meneghiniana.AAC.1